MNEPTIEQRLDLWRYAYSRSSFIEAQSTAQLLLQMQSRLPQDHRTALLTALIVTYARPFTVAQVAPKRKLIPMHDIPIPAEHITLHTDHMEMRHQVFGHKDATGPDTGSGLLNQVRFVLQGGYLNLHTVRPGHIDPQRLQETETLTQKLIVLLDDRINTFMESHPFPISGNEGVYILNLDDESKPWILKE